MYVRHGKRAWLVGGCVRDSLLGKAVHDWDIATDALPEQTSRFFKRVIPTGIDHGTVTVHWRREAFEVTTLRGEGAYSDGRRPDEVRFVDDITEDLARRDFTVNAMAFDPTAEELVDPFGGMVDLEARCLRAVGDANLRFREDGLRPLRGARFCATLEATLDKDTEEAIAPNLDVFRKVSHERVRDEWLKALRAPKPSRAFEVMERTGLLAASCPPLAAAAKQPWPGGGEGGASCLAVLLTCLDHARSTDAPHTTLLAALFHGTVPEAGGGVERTTANWLSEYRFSNQEKTTVQSLLRQQELSYGADWSDREVRRWVGAVSAKHVSEMLRFRRSLLSAYQAARVNTRTGAEPVSLLRQLDAFSTRAEAVVASGCALTTRDLAIDGKTLIKELGIKPGPAIGTLLGVLLEQVLETPELNEPGELLRIAKESLEAAGG